MLSRSFYQKFAVLIFFVYIFQDLALGGTNHDLFLNRNLIVWDIPYDCPIHNKTEIEDKFRNSVQIDKKRLYPYSTVQDLSGNYLKSTRPLYSIEKCRINITTVTLHKEHSLYALAHVRTYSYLHDERLGNKDNKFMERYFLFDILCRYKYDKVEKRWYLATPKPEDSRSKTYHISEKDYDKIPFINDELMHFYSAAKGTTSTEPSNPDDFSEGLVKEDKKSPQIVFKTLFYDFGTIEGDGITSHRFSFYNKGDRPLIIEGVQISCGCMGTLVGKKELQTGESSSIIVEYNSSGKRGRQIHNVIVFNTDPNNPKITLTLTGIVKRDIAVNPSHLFVGNVGIGEPRMRRITITDTGENKVEIEGIDVCPSILKFDLRPCNGDEKTLNVT